MEMDKNIYAVNLNPIVASINKLIDPSYQLFFITNSVLTLGGMYVTPLMALTFQFDLISFLSLNWILII